MKQTDFEDEGTKRNLKKSTKNRCEGQTFQRRNRIILHAQILLTDSLASRNATVRLAEIGGGWTEDPSASLGVYTLIPIPAVLYMLPSACFGTLIYQCGVLCTL